MNAPTNMERTSTRRLSGRALLAMLVSLGFVVGIVAVITLPVQSETPSLSDSKIVFDRNADPGDTRDIYVMNADGSGVTQLTTEGEERFPAWSPDGSKIAYTDSSPSGSSDIYVMNADGSNKTNLTNTPGVGESNPDWGVSAAPTPETVTQEVSAGQTPTTVTTDA